MISRKKRLPRALFLGFLKQGRVFNSPPLSLRVALETKEGYCAVVVSKKSVKTAVGRNKLRRQGYYLFKKYIINNRPYHTGILFIKKNMEFRELEKEFMALATIAGLKIKTQ